MEINIAERTVPLRGAMHLLVLDRQGRIQWRYESHNLIVTVGRDKLAKLLGGQHAAALTQIAVGTNGTPAASSDTAITNAFKKALDAKRYSGYSGTWYGQNVTVTSGQVRCEWFLNNSEANGLAIREFGLLFADDTLFARYLRPPNGATPDEILKQADMTLAGSWTINCGV